MKSKYKHIKHLLIFTVLSWCINYTVVAVPVVIDQAVNPDNSNTYYLLSSSSWIDAQTAAVAMGGNLVAVSSLAENNWIWNLWGNNRDLWIGLYDPITGDGSGAQHAADFLWSSGDSSTYRNWRPGEPNNGGGGSAEYFAYILAQGLDGGGQWNDWTGAATVAGQPNLYGVVEVTHNVPDRTSTFFLTFSAISIVVFISRKKMA